MNTLAVILSVAALVMLAWQIFGSVWNIVAIVWGLFKDR